MPQQPRRGPAGTFAQSRRGAEIYGGPGHHAEDDPGEVETSQVRPGSGPILAFVPGAGLGASSRADFDRDVKPFLARHCVALPRREEAEGRPPPGHAGAGFRRARRSRGTGRRSWTGSTPARCRRRRSRGPKADEVARVAEWIAGAAHRGRGRAAGGDGREGLLPAALARGISQHDPRPARRDLRRQRPHRPARRPGLAGLRADRLGADALAGARREVPGGGGDGAERGAGAGAAAEGRGHPLDGRASCASAATSRSELADAGAARQGPRRHRAEQRRARRPRPEGRDRPANTWCA